MTSGVARGEGMDLPQAAFLHLRRALRKETGTLGAMHVLHDVGFGIGESLFADFAHQMDVEVTEMDESVFWQALDKFFHSRGWGRVTQERVHPGLGVLRASEWAESDPESGETQPSCGMTAGVMAHILGRAADGSIAVLEVACRSRGDDACSFLFGSEGAIHEVYGLLLEGTSLEQALDQL